MSDTPFFMNYDIKTAVNNVSQQLRRYVTACENEKASYRIVEDAISERLIPIVENMMVDDAMEGGSHPMKHHTYQGQPALFCSHSCYVANYGFSKGLLYNELKKIGDLPFYDARNMVDEGNRLLDMIDDLSQGMSYASFNQKYHRVPKLKGVDRLFSGIERMVDDAAKSGFGWDKITDVMPYYNTTTGECGIYLDFKPDKKISDYVMFQFLSQNRQALGVGIPTLKNDILYVDGAIQRYNLHMRLTLTNPQKSKDEFQLKSTNFDLVYRDLPAENIFQEGFMGAIVDIDLSAEDTRPFSSNLLKEKVFPQHYKPLGAGTIGEHFNKEYEDGLKRLAAKKNAKQ